MSPTKDAVALQRIYQFYDLQREMLLADPQTLRSPAVRREVERKLRAMTKLAQEISRKGSAYLGGVDPIETARVIKHYLNERPRLRTENESKPEATAKPARVTPIRSKTRKTVRQVAKKGKATKKSKAKKVAKKKTAKRRK